MQNDLNPLTAENAHGIVSPIVGVLENIILVKTNVLEMDRGLGVPRQVELLYTCAITSLCRKGAVKV